jgi:hypothetical protein
LTISQTSAFGRSNKDHCCIVEDYMVANLKVPRKNPVNSRGQGTDSLIQEAARREKKKKNVFKKELLRLHKVIATRGSVTHDAFI